MQSNKPNRTQSTRRGGSKLTRRPAKKGSRKTKVRAPLRRRGRVVVAPGAIVRRPARSVGLQADIREFTVPVQVSSAGGALSPATTYEVLSNAIAGFDSMAALWESVAVVDAELTYDPISAIAHDGQLALQWELDTLVTPAGMTYDSILVNVRNGLAMVTPVWSSIRSFKKPRTPNDSLPNETNDPAHKLCSTKKFGFSYAVVGYRPNDVGVADRIGTLCVRLRLRFTGRRVLPPANPLAMIPYVPLSANLSTFSAAPSAGVDREEQ